MATIYSKRFGVGQVSGTAAATFYTVPAGVVAVVRDIILVQESGTAGNCAIVFVGTSYVFTAGPATGLVSYHLDCRVVLAPGEQLEALPNGGTWNYLVSGYELDA